MSDELLEELQIAGFTKSQAQALVRVFEKKKKKKPTSEANLKVWEAYDQAYLKRYNAHPVRNATVNTHIKSLVARLGEEAVDVIRFYVEHNDQFYVKIFHPVSVCVQNAESLRTQWKTGLRVTVRDARQAENKEFFENQMGRVKRGEV